MKCNGAKCITPIMGQNPIADFAMQSMQLPGAMPMPMGVPSMPMNMPLPGPSPMEINALMQPPLALPRQPIAFDNFQFRQKNRFGNLRG
jgi:hypothetical protein